MLKATEFAERQYETTFHLELGAGRSGPFVPTQPLERYLGIDAATNPQHSHRIFRLLNANIPRRIMMSPALWPLLPTHYFRSIPVQLVSIFFQFKVPRHNDAVRAKYRARFACPYYEVAVTPHQQAVLLDLQRRVKSGALVRYAAPVFWTRSAFDAHASHQSILTNSAYISPSRVGTHRKWMYAPSVGSSTWRMILNPEPEVFEDDGWETISQVMTEKARLESITDHIGRLASLVQGSVRPESDATPAWVAQLREYTHLSPKDERLLVNLRTVVDAAEHADTTWIIMVNLDGHARRFLEQVQS